MLRLLILWVVLSVPLGFWAHKRGRNGVTWLLVALLVSPLIAAMVLAARKPLNQDTPVVVGPSRTRRFLRFLMHLAMALAVVWLFLSLLNQSGMQAIRLAHQSASHSAIVL